MRVILAGLLLLAIPAAPASAQDQEQEGSAIGELLLNITADGRPLPGVGVAIMLEESTQIELVAQTDDNGIASINVDDLSVDQFIDIRFLYSSLFASQQDLDVDIDFDFNTDMEERIAKVLSSSSDSGVNSIAGEELNVTWRDDVRDTRVLDLEASGSTWGMGNAFVVFFSGDRVRCNPSASVREGEGLLCGVAELPGIPTDFGDLDPEFSWLEGFDPKDLQLELKIEIDLSCDGGGVDDGRPRGTLAPSASGYVSFRQILSDAAQYQQQAIDPELDSHETFTFDSEFIAGSEIPPPPDCAPSTGISYEPVAEGPQPSLFLLHGYNLDFEDGAWGIMGWMPVRIGDLPVTVRGGLDYYPQTETRSTTALSLDASYHFPQTFYKHAHAYASGGLRAYRQTSDAGGASSSSTEIGAGIVSGMTYTVGPIQLFGDIGVDRVYDAFVPVTHFGVGYTFGE